MVMLLLVVAWQLLNKGGSMGVTNNVVSMPIRLSEVASLLGVANNNSAICKVSSINKWSAVKPVDLAIVDHSTYDKLSDINFGLVPSSITTLLDRAISTRPNFTPWTYVKPQGGVNSPYRLGDFCVPASTLDTTPKGYKHDAQTFIDTKDCELDVNNGRNTILPLQFIMNGSKLEYSANSGANINIDLQDLSLDYKSTAEQGSAITPANRRITCGYWRIGLVVIVPLYAQPRGYDVMTGIGAYLCCAKDVISTTIISNILTQSVRFNYGCDNALLMMKRAMICDDTNTFFEALPVLVFNSSYDEDAGKWKTPSKLLTFPNTGYIKLNMSNMIACTMVVSSQGLAVDGTSLKLAPNVGYIGEKSTLSVASSVVSTIRLSISKPSGDSWEDGRVTILGYSCAFTQSIRGDVMTLTITWPSNAVAQFKSTIASAPVSATVAFNGQIRYLSSIKGADVYTDIVVPIKLT